MKFVSIDIETTGLNPKEHQIIEFAAVIADTDGATPVDEFPSFRRLVFHGDGYKVQPYAATMHVELWKELAQKSIVDENCCYSGSLEQELANWLRDHGFEEVKDPLKDPLRDDANKLESIVAAGKNFGAFDLQFLLNNNHWGRLVKFSHRTLDPAMLFLRHDDEKPPSLKQCMERAGIPGEVPHTALEDARIVVELIRRGMKEHE